MYTYYIPNYYNIHNKYCMIFSFSHPTKCDFCHSVDHNLLKYNMYVPVYVCIKNPYKYVYIFIIYNNIICVVTTSESV